MAILTLCTFALAVIGSLAHASLHRPRVFPQQTLEKKPSHYRASGVWGVSPNGRRLTVRWSCSPFEIADKSRHRANAKIRLRSMPPQGLVKATVVKAHDTTAIRKGRDHAVALASVQGEGLARFAIELEIDRKGCPSGEYCATVDATISAL